MLLSEGFSVIGHLMQRTEGSLVSQPLVHCIDSVAKRLSWLLVSKEELEIVGVPAEQWKWGE